MPSLDGEVPGSCALPIEVGAGRRPAAAARGGHGRVLELVQAWLADERFAGSRLVVVTRGAVAASTAGADPAAAAVWGLVRSAQPSTPAGSPARPRRVGPMTAARPAIAAPRDRRTSRSWRVRDGGALVPRLARLTVPQPDDPGRRTAPVLITGGTGGLGALVARHLVAEHGVRHLRARQPSRPGAPRRRGVGRPS